jgi:hypothetical protein
VDSSQLALYGLAVVVAAAIGFFLWALLRLELEKRQPGNGTAHPEEPRRVRY